MRGVRFGGTAFSRTACALALLASWPAFAQSTGSAEAADGARTSSSSEATPKKNEPNTKVRESAVPAVWQFAEPPKGRHGRVLSLEQCMLLAEQNYPKVLEAR